MIVIMMMITIMATLRSRYGHYIFALWFLLMVALRNIRADRYIFILWFLLTSSFFPGLILAAADRISTILLHMVWP